MDFLKALVGEKYPKFESTVYADGCKTIVTVSRTLSPTHVDLDSPGYIENKFKKLVPILKEIGVTKNHKNIGLDCKPFIANEPEEKHEDA